MPNSTSPEADRADDGNEFPVLLDLLGIAASERVSICSQKPGSGFEHTTPRSRADAVALACSTPYADRDVWFSVNPVAVPAEYLGRGADVHVTRCAALFADIDIKSGGVSDEQVAQTVAKEIAAALGQNPAAVVFSGHGGHTYWTLDADDDAWILDTDAKRAAAQAVYRRFHRLCADVAASFGGRVDNVGQLSRILRVPGTHNRKSPADPVPVSLHAYPFGTGGPLSLAEVVEALDAYGVQEMPEDRERTCELVSEPTGWAFGEQTSPYVAAMVAGWPNDRPGSRHGWLVSQATRLACAYRLGRITEDDDAEAVDVLGNTFGDLLAAHGEARQPTPGEVAGALAWGVQRAASFSDDQAADEIGGPSDDGHADNGTIGSSRLTLPTTFWESRPSLRHVRDAAWSTLASPDATLAIIMATLSSSLPPNVRVDTGVRRPMPTHTFAALVGRSSGGFKSTAMEAADQAVTFKRSWKIDPLVDGPVLLAHDDDPDELTYRASGGTGQGLIENFMGEVPVPMTEGASKRTKTMRRQVRSNVLVSIDEGNGLAKALNDPNSIVGETLRELWSGVTAGQDNAKAENRRKVRRGAYSFGMIVGFQLSVLARLLGGEHAELGTPQRFQFAWTGAPDIPDEPVPFPGEHVVTLPSEPISMCPDLLARVRGVLLPQLRNGGTDRETDSHRVSVLVRMAALLAILDGRTEVSESDWSLAEMMADTSRAVAAHALTVKREKATRERNTRRAEQVVDAVAIHTATTGTGPERAAVLIETTIRAEGQDGRRAKWTGDDGIRRCKFNGDNRDDAGAGLELLIDRGMAARVKVNRTEYVELTN